MTLTELHPTTVAKLTPLFPAEASIRNPLDMIASATSEGYRSALGALLEDPNVDSVVAIFVPPLGVRQADVAEAIAKAASAAPAKPVHAVLMGREGLPQGKAELHEFGIPAYIFPESAARALSVLCRYREWRDRSDEADPFLPIDHTGADAIMAEARRNRTSKLSELDTLRLLEAYGIATAPAGLARSADEAVALAQKLGVPVVLKIVSPEVIHKTDVGGVRVGLSAPEEVRQGYSEIEASVRRAVPDAHIDGILVQRQLPPGRELIAGVVRDPSFGPLVMFGLGGVLVEVLRDVTFRVAPIHMNDARDMVQGIRSSRILDAIRGTPAANRSAIVEVLMRLSLLATDYPEIEEIDINPLLAAAEGAIALDGRILLKTRRDPT